jgi:hypothetical protein
MDTLKIILVLLTLPFSSSTSTPCPIIIIIIIIIIILFLSSSLSSVGGLSHSDQMLLALLDKVSKLIISVFSSCVCLIVSSFCHPSFAASVVTNLANQSNTSINVN